MCPMCPHDWRVRFGAKKGLVHGGACLDCLECGGPLIGRATFDAYGVVFWSKKFL